MRYKTHTLGCKVNFYETEAMEEILDRAGHEKTDGVADLYLINTCTVTALAEQKSRQFLRRAKRENADAMVVAVGCYAQVNPDEIAGLGVDLVVGTQDRMRIAELIEDAMHGGTKNVVRSLESDMDFEALTISDTDARTRAFMKIEDGCDRYCAYCKIPYARGPVRSRSLVSIREEAERLVREGFREIVLTGIHVASFGRGTDEDLADGVAIVAEAGAERVRLSSMDPMWITRERLARLADIPAFCDHFHLSLQSGSTEILRAMGRPYTREDFLDRTRMIREFFPDVGLSTDLIAGFPGETEEDLEDSRTIIGEARFHRVHVFPYSRREGTRAAKMTERLTTAEKKHRAAMLSQEAERVRIAEEEKRIGTVVRVLTERADEEDAEGFSTQYERVFVPHARENALIRVQILKRDGERLIGKEI